MALSVPPDQDRATLKSVLEKSTGRIGSDQDASGHIIEVGFGRVNAAEALARAKSL